jgi:hypothetical protein
MSAAPSDPRALLNTLRSSLAHLQHLAELHSDDDFYARSAEHIAAVVAGLESRMSPGGNSGIPTPPTNG